MLTAALLALAAAQDLPPKAPPGWTVEVVKKYPDIKHPSVVCSAPDGRLFVAEDPMDMGESSTIPVDRILCIFPDGRTTVFAEKLYAVFGLQYIDGKLYVHHTPRFSVFTDDNGVGKDRIDLIEQTHPNPGGAGFNDHIPSHCRLAMDGFLYVSVGDKGLYGAVGKDGRKAQIHGGGVFRIRPDGTDLEVFSTGTRNHLDVAINAEDEIFTYDNTDDGHGWWTRVTHMVDGGFYGYPWDYKPRRPYTLWMMGDFGGGSGTGSIAYNEDAWPEPLRGSLFLSEWTRKQFIRLEIEREGATFRIARREDVLTQQGPSDFRPVGSCVSADGRSIYICDWNFGGWKQKDKEVGRLIKLTFDGPSKAAPKPAWWLPAAMGRPFEASTADLMAGLSHPAQSVRLVAQRRLADRKAVAELEAVVRDAKAPPHARWHAIWALDACGRGRDAIVAALGDTDASVRRQAARQLGTSRAKGAVEPLVGLLKDADASVRFHAATALGRIGSAAAVAPLRSALEEADLFARYAAFTALNRIGRAAPHAWPAIVEGLASPSERIREGTAFAVRETYELALAEALAAAPGAPAVRALAELHRRPPDWKGQWWGTQPVAQPRPAKTVEYAGTPVVLAALRKALAHDDPAVRAAGADGLALAKDASAAEALRGLARDADVEVRKAALRALGALRDRNAETLVAAALRDPALLAEAVAAAEQIGGDALVKALVDVLDDAGLPAIEALGRLKAAAAAPALARQLGSPDAKTVQAAIAALTAVGGDAATAALLPVLEDRRAEVRRGAVTALGALQARAAVPALLRAYLDAETRFEAVGALAQIPDLRALDAYVDGLGSRNATLRERCAAAVAAVHADALPLLERKLAAQLLSAEVIRELQRIYNRPAPILDWKLLGAFARSAPMPFEPGAVALDRTFTDAKGKSTGWRAAKVQPETGKVELRGQMSVQDDSTAYAFAVVESAVEREVEFMCGADDTFTLWVNGAKVFEDLRDGGWKIDEIRARATLKPGRNEILVKCDNSGGGWEFSVAAPPLRKGPLFEASAKTLDPKAYERHATAAKGDVERGRALFMDLKGVACVKCHKLKGEGGEVGPELTTIGQKFNRAQLIESVLYPSKQILDGYRQTKVLTKSGAVLSGRLASETADELVLLDAEGKRHALRKGDIDQRRESELSLMPDGLNTGLSLQDFADLVAFLEALR